jgi:hypothetical protein
MSEFRPKFVKKGERMKVDSKNEGKEGVYMDLEESDSVTIESESGDKEMKATGKLGSFNRRKKNDKKRIINDD